MSSWTPRRACGVAHDPGDHRARKDGVDLVLLGTGAVETLVNDHGELLASEISTELATNPAFVRALSSCYLFDLSERLLIDLADTCRRLLRNHSA